MPHIVHMLLGRIAFISGFLSGSGLRLTSVYTIYTRHKRVKGVTRILDFVSLAFSELDDLLEIGKQRSLFYRRSNLIDSRTMAWSIVCLLAWFPPAITQAQSWNDASVKIWNRTDSITSVGSGTIIGSNGDVGLVLTVKHLFNGGAGEIVVKRRDQHGYRGTLLAVDECANLAAIMILDTDDLPQVPIARSKPRPESWPALASAFMSSLVNLLRRCPAAMFITRSIRHKVIPGAACSPGTAVSRE